STIESQRQELQLLIAEQKDRDEVLSDIVTVHQSQFGAWEDNWQKILTLSEQCKLLKDKLNKKNEIIKSLIKRLKFLESQQNDSKTMIENTQKFKELSQKVTHSTVCSQALQEKNQRLPCSVSEQSVKTSQLQAGEPELKLKVTSVDEVILETTTSKFQKQESALGAAKMEEFIRNKEKQDLKLRLDELILETNKLKDDFCEKMRENSKEQEEIIHLKQENDCLRQELALA
ncbi:CCD62 protein, partial [Geococcyx californianus]|nr:CCD62 protein [Geococcyx californianus]